MSKKFLALKIAVITGFIVLLFGMAFVGTYTVVGIMDYMERKNKENEERG